MENWGEGIPSPYMEKVQVKYMYTITNIITDVQRGIAAYNMIETCFSYRIVYFVNENGKGTKFCVDTSYAGLWEELENIIRGNLSTTNTIVVAAVTTRRNGEVVSLLSRAYPFSLSGYFQKIVGEKEKEYKTVSYGRRRANWG